MTVRSQNGRFVGDVVEESEDDHPLGEAIARLLGAGLTTRGWTVGEHDSWRDAGWELPCQRSGAELDVVVLSGPGGTWLTQISPTRAPGLIGRLLGRVPSAGATDIHALAADVQALLAAGGFTSFRWQWDGFPEDDSPNSPSPPPA